MAYEYEGSLNDAALVDKKYLSELKRKAKAFDELVEFYPQKDEIPSDEFFMMMGYIIEGYKDELKEVHSKAKAFDEIVEYKRNIMAVKEISLTHATEEPFNSDMYSVHSLVDNLLDVINDFEERADDER